MKYVEWQKFMAIDKLVLHVLNSLTICFGMGSDGVVEPSKLHD